MKYVLFYSWQSDVDAALTRNFIEDALNKAARSLTQDQSILVEAVIDRDTSGVGGAPGISETIFQKIDVCDVFVCDVSIINNDERDSRSNSSVLVEIGRAAARIVMERTSARPGKKRPTPNPNVLVELGYAAARIGWDRIILVQNTAYGNIDSLPFDLRGRRTISFHLASKNSRAEERGKLRDQLERALRNALQGMVTPTVWMGVSRKKWFGFWYTPTTAQYFSALFVREVGAEGFLFDIAMADGARTGRITGFANYTGPDSAYARIESGLGEPCELKFRRSTQDVRQIVVEETFGCRAFKGMGATFEGTYTSRKDLLFDYGALDELDLQRLYSITGQYLRPLLDRYEQIGPRDCKDSFGATVHEGGAKGSRTIVGAMVMKGRDGQLWAAYIDDNVIRYFTTEPDFKSRLPVTIESWRESTGSLPVEYGTDIRTVPEH